MKNDRYVHVGDMLFNDRAKAFAFVIEVHGSICVYRFLNSGPAWGYVYRWPIDMSEWKADGWTIISHGAR